MIIAIAGSNLEVSYHFGYCEVFYLFELDRKRILSSKTLPNPGHKPGYLPVFLNEQGVNVIICGGMGAGAINIFNEYNIEVITGANGLVETTIQNYIEGKLESSNSICEEHHHEH